MEFDFSLNIGLLIAHLFAYFFILFIFLKIRRKLIDRKLINSVTSFDRGTNSERSLILGLLKREDYNRVEVENVINKITTSQDVEENQIKPILNNIAKKKEKGTYTEQFGHAAMRYVVDQQTDLPEEQKDEIATSLLAKYE